MASLVGDAGFIGTGNHPEIRAGQKAGRLGTTTHSGKPA
jgi:hypothetical protein